eukprot:3893664-Heterocapsa_arctica.AAC.1
MDDSFNEGVGRLLRDVVAVNLDDIDVGKGGSPQRPNDVRSPRARRRADHRHGNGRHHEEHRGVAEVAEAVRPADQGQAIRDLPAFGGKGKKGKGKGK